MQNLLYTVDETTKYSIDRINDSSSSGYRDTSGTSNTSTTSTTTTVSNDDLLKQYLKSSPRQQKQLLNTYGYTQAEVDHLIAQKRMILILLWLVNFSVHSRAISYE